MVSYARLDLPLPDTPGEHDQAVPRDLEVDPREVVGAGIADADVGWFGHRRCLTSTTDKYLSFVQCSGRVARHPYGSTVFATSLPLRMVPWLRHGGPSLQLFREDLADQRSSLHRFRSGWSHGCAMGDRRSSSSAKTSRIDGLRCIASAPDGPMAAPWGTVAPALPRRPRGSTVFAASLPLRMVPWLRHGGPSLQLFREFTRHEVLSENCEVGHAVGVEGGCAASSCQTRRWPSCNVSSRRKPMCAFGSAYRRC